jgi:outer membrane lipoprotein-sorting protein
VRAQVGRIGAAAVLLLTLSACGGSSTPAPPAASSPAPATSSASPSPSASPSSTSSSSSSSLRGVVLKQGDFSRTDLTLDEDGVEPAPEAGDLTRASFDYCGGTFRQEGSRVERYSVTAGFVEPQPGSISNEIVRYGSAAEATAALEEFRTAVRNCDEGSHPSIITDGKMVTFRPRRGPSTVSQLANNNTVVQSELLSEFSAADLTQFIVQYDSTLVVMVVFTPDATQSTVNEAVGTLGTLVGQRL